MTYQDELRSALILWVDTFSCMSCANSPVAWVDIGDETAIIPKARYVSAKIEGIEGNFGRPPILYCFCHDVLYLIQSEGMYDLLDQLFEKDSFGNIIIPNLLGS